LLRFFFFGEPRSRVIIRDLGIILLPPCFGTILLPPLLRKVMLFIRFGKSHHFVKCQKNSGFTRKPYRPIQKHTDALLYPQIHCIGAVTPIHCIWRLRSIHTIEVWGSNCERAVFQSVVRSLVMTMLLCIRRISLKHSCSHCKSSSVYLTTFREIVSMCATVVRVFKSQRALPSQMQRAGLPQPLTIAPNKNRALDLVLRML
jgi:hypothetical protein